MSRIKSQGGVSLLELVVAVAIFVVITLASIQTFKMVVDGQRNALAAQNVQENMRYALEKISKEIRMAQISDEDCEQLFSPKAKADKKVFNLTGPNKDVLYFKNQDGVCVAYYLANGRLESTIEVGGHGYSDFLTPAKIQVSNLKFNVVDDKIVDSHSVQPYVTMVMDIQAVGLAIHQQKMKIQFTVSSRCYVYE
jgi:type II secretory pathway component PulJ